MKILKYFLLLFVFSATMLTMLQVSYGQEDVLWPNRKKAKPDSDIFWEKSPWTIGVEAGINYNMFKQSFWWNTDYLHGSVWDGLQTASGFSPHFGVFLDYSIDKTFAIMLRISYDTKWYGTSTSGNDYAINALDNLYYSHEMDLDVNVTSAYVTLTPLLRINFTDRFFMTVGPTIHYASENIKTTWKPTSKDGTSLGNYTYWGSLFPGDVLASGEITTESNTLGNESLNSPRYGLEVGLGYKFLLSPGIYLVPQGRMQLMFTEVAEDWGWQTVAVPHIQLQTSENKMLHSLVFALGLWFEL